MNNEKSFKYLLAEKQVLIPLSTFLFIAVCLTGNFIFNLLFELIKTTFSDIMNPQPFNIKVDYIFQFMIKDYPYVYAAIFIIASIVVLKFVYELRSNFKNLNKNQKGSSRFTTEKELKKQYKAVQEKTERYSGGGGVVISRYAVPSFSVFIKQLKKVAEAEGMEKWSAIKKLKSCKVGKLCIDDSPVNNLIIGTTRSGKGETFVFPTIDVYSRAENQPSLIFNDPKGELFAASKDTLEKRGFHIEVLNLLNPLESMSYNLLQLVKDAYKEGDYSTAQSLCKTLSHTLYYNPSADDPFWQQCAMSLCNAMILAITDKCIQEGTEDKITMYAVANMLSELGSQEVLDENDDPQNALDMYFQLLPADSVAKMQYATSNFSKGATRGGIFTQTMNGLSIFTFDEIAKMTSKNSIDLKRVGFGKTIKGKAAPRKRVEVIFADNTKETIKTDTAGRFELNFKQEVKVEDHIQVVEKESGKKVIVSVKELNNDTGKTILEVIEEDDGISITSIDYFDKPIAIFMITPDYDSSNHVIASIFVRQLYFILAKYASLARGNKCHREVVFMLDEFGNMPSIEGMANIITVCLGRNIRFNLIIQAYAQLKNKYDDDAPTIDGNCGNTIYILTNNYDTAQEISKKLGEGTINSTSRSGKTLSLDKSKTESVDGRHLLTPNELMGLEEGESVVIRVIKRQDVERKKIKATPIFNTGRTVLKYRWEYLGDDFDTDKSILDVDIESLHDEVNPKDLLVNFFKEPDRNDKSKNNQEEKKNKEDQEQKEQDNHVSADLPFSELSIDNWQSKTVEEFFESDLAMLKIIEEHFLSELDKTIDEIKSETMEEFYGELKILGHNDRINNATYQAVSGKIKKIINELKKKKEGKETSKI